MHNVQTIANAALLSEYFSRGTSLFERSTCASVLARGELFSRRTRCQPIAEHAILSASGKVIGYANCSVAINPDDSPGGITLEDMHEPLKRYGKVSRWLMGLEALELQLRRSGQLQLPTSVAGPVLGAVLECEHGDLGALWARAGKPGRLGATFHLTAAGARWLDVVARAGGAGLSLTAAQRMANEVQAPAEGSRKAIERARRRQGVARKQALDAIALQAARLSASAAWLWNAVVQGERGRAAA